MTLSFSKQLTKKALKTGCIYFVKVGNELESTRKYNSITLLE